MWVHGNFIKLHGWGRWVLCHPLLLSITTPSHKPCSLLLVFFMQVDTSKSNAVFHINTQTLMHKIIFFFCAYTHRVFVPLHCLRADWDRDQPSLPFKIHKTINLTSTDHPILLGSPDANSSLDFTSCMTSENLLPKELTANPVVVSYPESLRLTQVRSDFNLSLFPAL